MGVIVLSCGRHKNLDPKSTIDSTLQAATEQKLKEYMMMCDADWACVVLMQADSGQIRALVNLSRDTAANSYSGAYNYAVTELIEPGQLFTLATIMACLEDKVISLKDSINIEKGTEIFDGKTVADAQNLEKNFLTVQDAFIVSSNIAFARIVNAYYKNNPGKFIDRLKSFRLDKSLGIDDLNEPVPYLPDVNSSS